MRRILIADVFSSQEILDDAIFRIYHHLSFVKDVKIYILRSDSNVKASGFIPSYFGKRNVDTTGLSFFLEKIAYRTVKTDKCISEISRSVSHVIIYSEIFYKKYHETIKSNKPKIYWCDRDKTRQEGSNYIQAALDLLPASEKETNITKCMSKFRALAEGLKGKYDESVVLATGPSIEGYHNYEMKNKLCIACNSTILNKDLVDKSNVKIVVFADPIFHFGVSKYADEFRGECKAFLDAYRDVNIVIPIKYYALLTFLMPEYADRIIGIPFTKHDKINLEISDKAFYTYTTANILTLLLLPLATSFTKKVNLIGCDGRDINDDDYFWGHGNSVQINDQMKNIQECHPGFFKIDYNEYYFQHCHTLDNIINYAELKGYRFEHWGDTYIPALKNRSSNNSLYDPSIDAKKRLSDVDRVYIIEPDGLDFDSGHYLSWHIGLLRKIQAKNENVTILANELASYPKSVNAENVFSDNSWTLQRGSGAKNLNFPFDANMKRFFNQISVVIEKESPLVSSFHFFMYYGSVQVVKCFLELQKKYKNIDFKFTVCIFSESVNISKSSPETNFHPHAKSILTEAVAKTDSFRVFSVTRELSEQIYSLFEVKMPVMPHPIVNKESLQQHLSKIENDISKEPPYTKLSPFIELYIPTRLGHGKSSTYLKDAIAGMLNNSYNLKLKIRDSKEAQELLSDLPADIKNNRVILVDTLSDFSFVEELHKADIVLIPYPSESFWARTSGILYDTVMIGKPVITMNKTWLSRVAKELKFGIYVSHLDSDGASILNAVSLISQNKMFFINNLISAKELLASKENFESLTDLSDADRLNPFRITGM